MRGQFIHLPQVFTPFLHSVHWIALNHLHHFFRYVTGIYLPR